MKLVYLAHPYGGDDANVGKAIDLCSELSARYPDDHIFNAVAYFRKFKDVFTEGEIEKRYLDMLRRCDELWLVPGWTKSSGCCREYELAVFCGVQVRELEQDWEGRWYR